MHSSTEVTGLYVTAFLESAGEVSAVFEKKLRQVLQSNGIEDPSPEEWYSADDFVDAVVEVSETIGDKTVRQASVEMGHNVPWADEVDDPKSIVEKVDESGKNAYRNHSGEYAIGRYVIEEFGDGTATVAVEPAFPYPIEVAEGATKGAMEVACDEANVVSVESVEAEPNRKGAFRLTW